MRRSFHDADIQSPVVDPDLVARLARLSPGELGTAIMAVDARQPGYAERLVAWLDARGGVAT